MKEELEQLKAQVVELTRVMGERAKAGYANEVKELSDKLIQLQAQVNDRKMQFDAGQTKSTSAGVSKEAERKMDELFIASALLTRKDGSLDRAAFDVVKSAPDYRDALKDAGIVNTFGSGQTTADAEGGDFIPAGFSSTLLEEIWLKLEIANLFGRFNMTSPTFTFPFAPDRLTARLAAEGVAPTKDQFATDQIIFNAKKIMSNVDFTDEIELDSIVAILPLVRTKLIEGFAIAQEQICLNGDTTAGADNLNGNVAADDVRRTTKGVRALANAADMVSFATGNFSAANLRSLRAAMGKYGKSTSDLAYIMTMKDYNSALAFEGYQYLYQYAGAVTTAGELGRIDNIPIIVTELLPSTSNGATAGVNASGVVDATGANNTKNICGLVNKNPYMWGDRKAFALETFRNPFTQATSLIGSQRLDFQKTISAADPTAVWGVNYV